MNSITQENLNKVINISKEDFEGIAYAYRAGIMTEQEMIQETDIAMKEFALNLLNHATPPSFKSKLQKHIKPSF